MTGLILYFAVSLLIGILACFFGKKMFFQVFAAVAFLVVFDIALTRGDGTTLTLIIAVLLGVAAAFLSKYLYKLSVFLLGLWPVRASAPCSPPCLLPKSALTAGR